MTFAELLKNTVPRIEGTRISAAGVSEYEASFVQYGNLVAVFQFPSLVPTDQLFLYKRAVDGQVFKNSNDIAISGFIEEQTVTVGDGGNIKDHVALRMSTYKIASSGKTLNGFLSLVLVFVVREFLFPTPLALHCLSRNFEGLDRGRTKGSSLQGQSMSNLGGGKQVAPSPVIIVQISLEISRRVYKLR